MEEKRVALQKGAVLVLREKEYKIVSEISRGYTGIVYEAKETGKEGKRVAVKELFPLKDTVERRSNNEIACGDDNTMSQFKELAKNEFNLTKKVNNDIPDVMDSNDFCQDATIIHDSRRDEVKNCYTVMRLGMGCTLKEFIEEASKYKKEGYPYRRRDNLIVRPEILDSLTIMQKVVDAVSGLHNTGYVHCDLKPSNIFLHGFDLKNKDIANQNFMILLLDLGSAEKVGASLSGFTTMASPGFVPPEGQKKAEKEVLTKAYDIYSLSSILFHMTAILTESDDNRLAVMSQDELQSKVHQNYHVLTAGRVCGLHNRACLKEVEALMCHGLARDPAGGRYQTCEEFSGAISSIIKAINSKGITPHILKKNIRKDIEKKGESKIEVDILPTVSSDNYSYSNLYEAIKQLDNGNYQLVAKNVSGQTSSMLYVQKEIIESEGQQNTIPIYVNMCDYQNGKHNYVLTQMLEKYFIEADGSVGENEIVTMMRNNPDNRFLLLLDEIQKSEDPFAKETFKQLKNAGILGLSNVQVFLSTSCLLDELEGFTALQYSALNVDVVRDYLITQNIDMNSLTDSAIVEYLRDPINLIHFTKDHDRNYPDDFLRDRIKRICMKHWLEEKNENTSRELNKFTFEVLLPKLSEFLHKKATNTFLLNDFKMLCDELINEQKNKPEKEEFFEDIQWYDIKNILLKCGVVQPEPDDAQTALIIPQEYLDVNSFQTGSKSDTTDTPKPLDIDEKKEFLLRKYWEYYSILSTQKERGRLGVGEQVLRGNLTKAYQIPKLLCIGNEEKSWEIDDENKVVIAANGLGKSSFAQSLLLVFIYRMGQYQYYEDSEKDMLERLKEYHCTTTDFFPILVECKDFKQESFVPEKMHRQWDCFWIFSTIKYRLALNDIELSYDVFEKIIQENNILLILDGYDEMEGEFIHDFFNQIQRFKNYVAKYNKKCSLVITTRYILTNEEFIGFSSWKMLGFDFGNHLTLRSFVSGYITEEQSKKCVDIITKNRYLKEAITTPGSLIWIINYCIHDKEPCEIIELTIQQLLLRGKSCTGSNLPAFLQVYEEIAFLYLIQSEGHGGIRIESNVFAAFNYLVVNALENSGKSRTVKSVFPNKDDYIECAKYSKELFTNVSLMDVDTRTNQLVFISPIFPCHMVAKRMINVFLTEGQKKCNEDMEKLSCSMRYQVIGMAATISNKLDSMAMTGYDSRFNMSQKVSIQKYLKDYLKDKLSSAVEAEKEALNYEIKKMQNNEYGENGFDLSELLNE